MRQIGIHLLHSNTEYDLEYTYLAEESLIQSGTLVRGSFASVPFGMRKKTETGVVWSIGEEYTGGTTYELKEIKSVSGIRPPLEDHEIKLAERMSEMYFCSIGECVKCMVPPEAPGGRSVKYVSLPDGFDEADGQEAISKLRNIDQIRIIEMLRKGPAPAAQLARDAGCSLSVINTLEKKGLVNVYKASQARTDPERRAGAPALPTYDRHELNEEQKRAYDLITGLIHKRKFSECLVHGVTGSGKTELYMQLIADTVENGGNAVMLVPEIALTPQMTAHFTHRFGDRVAVLHSRMNDRERRRQWDKIKNGDVSVAIGARSAVFAPFEDLRLIILDEEHEPSYRSEDRPPRYHAAEIAEEIGKIRDAVIVYGSATPRVETYYRAAKGSIYYVPLTKRAGRAALPEIVTEDMREARINGEIYGSGIFSARMVRELTENYEKGRQAMLFVHRRGYARRMLCTKCGAVMKCGGCNLPMTYHEKGNRLICHHCGRTVPAPETCPACGSGDFDKKGAGTQKAAEELQKLFPNAAVLRMDTDTTSGEGGHGKILAAFASGEGEFLVGTQMIAKGHDFPNVTLVGIISADSLINMPDYKAEERAFELLTQMSGRAGRGNDAGKVIIQAYNMDDYAITASVHNSYAEFYRNEIEVRKALSYPPFSALCILKFAGENDKEVYSTAADACAGMKKAASDYMRSGVGAGGGVGIGGCCPEILGPARSEIPKVNNRYRWVITLKAADRRSLTDFLSYWTNNGKMLKKIRKNASLSVIFDGR